LAGPGHGRGGEELPHPTGLREARVAEGAVEVVRARIDRGHRVRVAGEDEERHAPTVLARHAGVCWSDDCSQAPVRWKPPSTWTISPVVAGNQSDSSETIALPAGSVFF